MQTHEPSPVTPSVVLVDDDRFLLDLYAMKFSHRGYDVHAYLSANDALKALREGLKPNALVTDLVMPELSGMTFLRTLLDEHIAVGTPRFILTNEPDKWDNTRAQELGISRVLVKAMMLPDEVVSAVDEAIGKKPSPRLSDLHDRASNP